MTLDQFIAWLLTTGGVGIAVFALIELADVFGGPISGDIKFKASIVLALLIPAAAYLFDVGIGHTTLSWDGLYTALQAGVVWIISQISHKALDAIKTASQKS